MYVFTTTTATSTRGAYGYLNFRQVCVCFHNSFHNWGLWLPLVSTDFTYRLILSLIWMRYIYIYKYISIQLFLSSSVVWLARPRKMEVRLNPPYPQSNVVVFLILQSPHVNIGKGGWGRTSILLRGVRCRSWSQRMMSRLMQHYDVQVDANLRCQRRCQLMMSWRIVPFQDVDVVVSLWCQCCGKCA